MSFPFIGLAQAQEDRDSANWKRFIPTGVRLGTDVVALIQSSRDDSYSGWEVNADVDFYRYFFTVDIGNWSRNFQSLDDTYSNDGNYFRVGIDVNFMPKDPNGNLLLLGARYGRSVFSETYFVHVKDTVWGTSDQHYVNTDVPARWFELTAGLRVKIWKIIWLGYTARYKFALATGSTPTMLPHDIPGYGRNEKKSAWGFNYQLLIRLPIRKK